MSDISEDPATLAAIVPDTPLDVPRAPLNGAFAVRRGEAALNSIVAAKLAASLFLHHVVIGAWFVTLGSYIAANTGSRGSGMFAAGFVGLAYGAGPLGATISPLLTGLLADRVFAAERLMAVLNVACAISMASAAFATSQGAFFLAIFVNFLCYHSSASLASSLALHHLARPERDFAVIRAFGTLGWITAGVLVGWIWPSVTGNSIEPTNIPLKISAAASVVTGLFCMFLPHTPPSGSRSEQGLFRETARSHLWELLGDRRFVALMALAVTAHIPSQFYYAYSNVFFNWAGMANAAAKMSLGQVVEVAIMLVLPLLLVRLSVKSAILAGLGIWGLRYLMLAAAASPDAPAREGLMYGAILLHGLAFTLTTISLQLDVDRCAGGGRRATAQGLFSVAVQGLGCFAGAQLAGVAGARLFHSDVMTASQAGWQFFWLLPAAASVAVVAQTALTLRRECGVVAHS